MKKLRNFLVCTGFLLICLTACSVYARHPAILRINNNTKRQLTVKVMRRTYNYRAVKYGTLVIPKYSTRAINFRETGYYYCKTKAESIGLQTLYTKGYPFRIYVGNDQYSVITITYSINENTLPDPTAGKQITRVEFAKDVD